MGFSVLSGHVLVWAGFAGGGLMLLWLLQRLVVTEGGVGVVASRLAVGRLLRAVLLPLAVVFVAGTRGAESCDHGGLLFSNAALRVGGGAQLLLPLLLLGGGVAVSGGRFGRTWVFERVAVVLWLQLAWTWAFQATSLLALLLWFEVAGLLAVLLVGFSGYTGAVGPTFRGRLGGGASHSSTTLAALVLLWTSGLSTILMVCGWSALYVQIPLLDVEVGQLLGGSVATPAPTHLVPYLGYAVGVGLLLKLMLQPVQFLLLSFYRALPLTAFVGYLGAYYPVFLVLVFGWLVGAWGAILAPWLFTLAATLVAVLVFVAGGVEHQLDVRTALAFSTLLNVGLLLLAAAVLGA